MRDIVVISAATALTYKGSNLDTRQIGRELGVRYLVIGSIARIGDLVRTNVQLVDAASGEQLWGDRFENQFVDLGGLENAITGRIAASLNVQLVRVEGRRADQAPQPDALDLRLRATSLFYSSVAPEHTLATRQLLQQSAALDPSSAETWARLGRGDRFGLYQTSWNDTGEEQLKEAEEAVRKALLIDPNHALAHVAHGLIQKARGEHHSALEAFSRAIELDRNFAFAYAHKGNELILVGPAGGSAAARRAGDQAQPARPLDRHVSLDHRPRICSLPATITRQSPGSANRSRTGRTCGSTACTWSALARSPICRNRRRGRCRSSIVVFPNPAYTLDVVALRESCDSERQPICRRRARKVPRRVCFAPGCRSIDPKRRLVWRLRDRPHSRKGSSRNRVSGELAMRSREDPLRARKIAL